MTGMTIVHLIGTGDFAGTERMVVTICQGQVQRGHQVAVVLRQRGRIEEFLRREGIEILGPRIGPMSAPWHVARECRRRGVNVLHSHLTSGTHVANAVSLLTGIPVVDHLHVYNRDISHVIASRFGRLIAVSQHTKEYYESRRYMKRSSIDVVPNASPILSEQDAGMQPATARRVVAEELRLPIDTPFITLAARVTEQKGQDIFVQAAEKVLMAWPDTHFLIAGSVEDAAFVTSLKDDIMARGIGGNVHILGFRTDVARLLRASVMAVIPSRYEPFGLSVIEPMLLGVPVIASNVGGIPDTIHDASLGVLVEVEAVDQLAASMLDLLSNEPYRNALAQQAQADAVKRFSVASMLDQIDEVYCRALGHRRSVQGAAPSR